jgi:predicted DsbA family dithiol-disulfide isomerase
MKIEIWSDIMCPFCYIGKRHLEKALETFPGKDKVEIEWKSFQLDPTIPMDLGEETNVYDYLAARKGISLEQVKLMHDRVSDMAEAVGLHYDFDQAKVANSLKSHHLIQFAKDHGKGDAIEERLFQAYFMEGKNLALDDVLVACGEDVGLKREGILEALQDENYAYRVKQDIQEGENLGVRGVPFFVFDRKYGISGAEPIEVFTKTLIQTAAE